MGHSEIPPVPECIAIYPRLAAPLPKSLREGAPRPPLCAWARPTQQRPLKRLAALTAFDSAMADFCSGRDGAAWIRREGGKHGKSIICSASHQPVPPSAPHHPSPPSPIRNCPHPTCSPARRLHIKTSDSDTSNPRPRLLTPYHLQSDANHLAPSPWDATPPQQDEWQRNEHSCC